MDLVSTRKQLIGIWQNYSVAFFFLYVNYKNTTGNLVNLLLLLQTDIPGK